MSILLKGAPVAAEISEGLKPRVEALKARGVTPKLAMLRVGAGESDLSYERGALKRCAAVGIEAAVAELPETVAQSELIAAIEALNRDKSVHGVLLFRPLPGSLDEQAACAALSPAKDVDGITSGSMARAYSGGGEGYAPCTAQSVMEILRHYGVEASGKRAAVIGRSLVIGRPAAMLLMQANATVTICHTKTADMRSITASADIIVVAAGKAESIGAEYFSENQTVIDVGISWSEEKQKLVGDVDFEAVEPRCAAITPVPGGVGGVTTAVLCAHVVEAAERGRP